MTITQRSAVEEWQGERARFHAERRTIIGGSDAAAILGLARWRTAFDVWWDKVNDAERTDESMPMRQFIGLRLEPLIAEMAAAKLGRKYRRRIALLRSREHEFIGGHVDYVGLEVKTSYSAEGWGPDGAEITAADRESWDAIPIDYLLQVQHYLYVTGWPRITVAVLIGHDDFRTYDVPPIPALIEPMVAEEVRFWMEHVVTGDPPPVDGSDGAKAYLRARFPRATGVLRAATPEESLLVEEVRIARQATKDAETAEETAKARLRAAIGSDIGLAGPGWTATNVNVERSPVTNWEAVAGAYRKMLIDVEGALGAGRTVESILPAELDAIVSLHTSTPDSYRRLNLAYSRRDR